MATVQAEQQDLLIAGEWTTAASRTSFENLNPFTGEVVGTAAAASPADARAAVDAAAAAFSQWSQSPPARRRELLGKAAELLVRRAPEIAATMTAETGSTFGWGMFNCELAAGMLPRPTPWSAR
jgi:acyl-CoA reductase-like NAD-dependent aldehyde dehydrogenase